MDTYTAMRHFADSWGLVFLTAVFVAVIVWLLRRGGGHYADQADIPFRHDEGDPR